MGVYFRLANYVRKHVSLTSPAGISQLSRQLATTGSSSGRNGRDGGGKDVPYVSGHYEVAGGQVEEYLERHSLTFKETSQGQLQVRICPFCHPTKGEASNHYKLNVNSQNGLYNCFRCGSKGNWWQFRNRVDGISVSSLASTGVTAGLQEQSASVPTTAVSKSAHNPLENARSARIYQESLASTRAALDYLQTVRGLSKETAEYFGVGCARLPFLEKDDSERPSGFSDHLCIVFPMIGQNNGIVRFKIRSIERKSAMRLEPKTGGGLGLFGLDKVPISAKEIILTEGEYDAMAVYQATGRPVVSLPNGAGSLPPDCLRDLERFEKIFLWLDDDIAGQQGVRQFSQKLGAARCLVVHTRGDSKDGPKDANEALLNGINLTALLDSASKVPHENILSFAEIRRDVLRELTNPEELQGVQAEFLPGLNKILKGHRDGELTILSGHTGTGKTTLLAQTSLDYACQGVPTLWGSFEINNVRLAKLLLIQFFTLHSRGKAKDLLKHFHDWAEEFESLPIYFMRFFGSSPIDTVLDAMEYANYVHDVRHVILDNLQFMTSGQGRRGIDKFDVMDNAVQKARQFATTNNVHVSLVVHPRKENDGEQLQLASVFGSAKATQEADNVIILQRGEKYPLLDIRKNRFDGQLGKMPILFDRERKVFTDLLNETVQIRSQDANDAELMKPPSKRRGRPPKTTNVS